MVTRHYEGPRSQKPALMSRPEALQPVRTWSAGRKSQLIDAVLERVVTAKEVLTAHSVSPEEMAEWVRRRQRGGIRGLLQTGVKRRERAENSNHGHVEPTLDRSQGGPSPEVS